MLKVAMTGGDGLVGSRIMELLGQDISFINLPQAELDITKRAKTHSVLKDVDFDIFLHLAAYTNVAGAETNREVAYSVNRDGTRNVFEAVSLKRKKFIYLSTDFVFNGNNPPYFEDSTPSPLGVYADSKYQGEKILEEKAMIVRISYPYRAEFQNKKDFYRTFKALLEQGKPLTMITDSKMTPTFIDDITYGLRHLISNYSDSTFHLVGASSCTPYEAAVMIADKFKLDKSLIGKTTYDEYSKIKPGLPRYADIGSKRNNFFKMKTFEEGLEEIKTQITKSG